MDLNSGGY